MFSLFLRTKRPVNQICFSCFLEQKTGFKNYKQTNPKDMFGFCFLKLFLITVFENKENAKMVFFENCCFI